MNRPREDWPRLASYVISARIAAGYRDRQEFAAATGITARTLGKLETGHPVSPETLAVVEQHVGWRPDSARQILAGGEPSRGGLDRDAGIPLDLTEEAVRSATDGWVAAVLARLAELAAERERGANGRSA